MNGYAELAIVAGVPGTETTATIGIGGSAVFPQSGGPAARQGRRRHSIRGRELDHDRERNRCDYRDRAARATRIMGTYEAFLRGEFHQGGESKPIDISISGKFDSGAPVNDDQALRGSPIPADLFDDEE